MAARARSEQGAVADREVEIAHGRERHTQKDAQRLPFRPDERVDADRGGNLVRGWSLDAGGQQDAAQPEHETRCQTPSPSLYTPGHPRRFYAEIDRRHDCSPARPCLDGVRDVDGDEPGHRQTSATEARNCGRGSVGAELSDRSAWPSRSESLDSGPVTGVAVDAQDHIWVLPGVPATANTELGPGRLPRLRMLQPAPPMLDSTAPVTCSATGVAGA
jgi:hypothetical protein